MPILDLMLIIGYLLLLISVFTLIQIAQYHTRTMNSLNKQIDYWRSKALIQNDMMIKQDKIHIERMSDAKLNESAQFSYCEIDEAPTFND